MKPTAAIIADKLSDSGYYIHKHPEKFQTIGRVCAELPDCPPFEGSCLYIIDGQGIPFENIPAHLIITGEFSASAYPGALSCIQAPPGVTEAGALLQVLDIFAEYAAWDKALIMAVLERVPIQAFIALAAQELTNPLALFDNSMTVLAVAGEFKNSYEGTIWDKVNGSGLVLAEFYSVREQRELAALTEHSRGMPYLHRPEMDKEHSYLSAQVLIDGEIYGNIGMVDINAPLTAGQQDTVYHITEMLKLYYRNNESYMRAAENRLRYFDELLGGAEVSADVVAYHLTRMKWKIDDAYFFMAFQGAAPRTQLELMSFLKQLDRLYPRSVASVIGGDIVMVVRADSRMPFANEHCVRLTELLTANEMRCGISCMFEDFMSLRFYYAQALFALEFGGGAGKPLTRYETCQQEHVLRELSKQNSLQCFCHPKIAALWDSKELSKRELVNCLESYLLNGRNISATARALSIHRNTLIYRLEKLRLLLGCDLEAIDGRTAFYFLFTCAAVRM